MKKTPDTKLVQLEWTFNETTKHCKLKLRLKRYEKQFESVKVRVIARFAMFLTGSFIFFQQLKYTVQYSRYKTYLIRNWNMIMPSFSDDPVGE